jgi:hypothetical protein
MGIDPQPNPQSHEEQLPTGCFETEFLLFTHAINPPGIVRTTFCAVASCIWTLAQSLVFTLDILGFLGLVIAECS